MYENLAIKCVPMEKLIWSSYFFKKKNKKKMEEDLNSKGTFNPPQDSQPTRLGLSTEELSSTANSQSSNSSRNIISSKFKKLILSLGKRGLGLLCLFGVVSLWVGSSVLMQV